MMKLEISHSLATALLAFGLTACGNSEPGTADHGRARAGDDRAGASEIANPDPEFQAFAGQFLASSARLRFTACEGLDAEQWLGASDPYGSLVCGAWYEIRYIQSSGSWLVSGPRESDGFDINDYEPFEHAYAGPAPENGFLIVWGGRYRFDEYGNVFEVRGEEAIGELLLEFDQP